MVVDVPTLSSAFYTEIEKVAKPRLVRAWQDAQASGNTQLADQYAKAYGDLGLKGRYLNDVSGGGGEAGVDRMMGRAPNGAGHDSGYLIRKMYKPDSQLHQGEFTRQTLEQKQQITDAARAHSPAAREMLPDMYGFKQHGTDANPRFTSYHEPVQIGSTLSGSKAVSAGLEAKNTLINPLAAKGMHIADVAPTTVGVTSAGKTVNTDALGIVYDQHKTTGGLANPGNIVKDTAGKTRVLDFLPGHEGQDSTLLSSSEKYRSGEGVGSQFRRRADLGALRKEVHVPTAQFSPQHLAQQTAMFKPPAGALRPPPSVPSLPQLGDLGAQTAATRAASIVGKAPVKAPLAAAAAGGVASAAGKLKPALGSLSSPFKSLLR